jgi:hypothetical protein
MDTNDAIISALKLLYQPGDVFEIRVLDAERPGFRRPHIESGYFDYAHIADVPQTLAEITTAMGVYITMNPVNPALLARSANRLKTARRNETTSDTDIVCRRWLLIDIDPARPAGISATDAEKELAFDKAMEVSEGLASMGWPTPVVVDSGNGYYLLYRIDLSADDGGLVHRCIQALQPVADESVHVDLSVANPSRICRLPGTWNRKGDDMTDRPHRPSEIMDAPDAPQAVTGALLEALAATLAPRPETRHTAPCVPVSGPGGRPGDDFNQRGDLASALEGHGWQRIGESGGNQLWRRPGKATGNHSATFDGRTFYVFSSAAPPFEANTGYSPFAVYAMLEHDGDYAAASACLAESGYGAESPTDDVDISGIMAMCGAHRADDADNSEMSATMRTCGSSRLDNAENSDISTDNADNPEMSATMRTSVKSRSDNADSSEISADDAHISERPADPGPLPDALLHVPGFIAQVMDYCLSTAPYPNPTLAFCGAICLQSYLAARRVRDQLNNRSNVYIVALANSGVGKDHPRQVNSEIAYQAGALRGIGDAFASGEGIEDAMFIHQTMLFQTDEIDAILGSINRARDGRNEMIMQILLKMYGSSRTRYPLRKKAGQTEPLVIQQPSLTLFGTAVPQYFYKALSGRMLNNGLFARTLVLDAGPRSRGRMPVGVPVPQPIIDTASWWVNYNPGGVHSGNLSGFHPEPATVPDTPDATVRSQSIWALTDDAYEEAQRQGDETKMAIWARAYEKVRKLALLYACSENHQTPQITVAGIDWAWAMVEHQTRRMLYMADLYVADSEFDADCKKLIEILTRWANRKPGEFMAHWDLSRRVRWPEKKIEEVRESLVAQDLIEVQMPQRGPMKPQYRLCC